MIVDTLNSWANAAFAWKKNIASFKKNIWKKILSCWFYVVAENAVMFLTKDFGVTPLGGPEITMILSVL